MTGSHLPSAHDSAIGLDAAGVAVESALVDHQVLTNAINGRERRGDEPTHEPVVVQSLDQQSATRAKHAMKLTQHAPVVVVTEISERGEPAEHGVEGSVHRQRAQVSASVVHLDPTGRCSLSGRGEKVLHQVYARNRGTEHSELCADASVAARRVQNSHGRLDIQEPDDLLDLTTVALLREGGAIEVQVVRAEHRVSIEVSHLA